MKYIPRYNGLSDVYLFSTVLVVLVSNLQWLHYLVASLDATQVSSLDIICDVNG